MESINTESNLQGREVIKAVKKTIKRREDADREEIRKTAHALPTEVDEK